MADDATIRLAMVDKWVPLLPRTYVFASELGHYSHGDGLGAHVPHVLHRARTESVA